MVMHWFNAVCWIFLLFSGFAILANPAVQPIGAWWVRLWEGLFGGAKTLLYAHILVGMIWAGLYALFVVCRFRSEVLPFLREVTDLNLKADLAWCAKKGLWLITDAATMRRMGINPELPPQGFYNAGQKLVAVLAVVSSIVLVFTGGLMLYLFASSGSEHLLQWCLLMHLCAAGVMAVFIPVHIYMAAFAPGEGPALRSMFTGWVPADFARHHNPLWHKKMKDSGKIVD